jgi:hypothetical protein
LDIAVADGAETLVERSLVMEPVRGCERPAVATRPAQTEEEATCPRSRLRPRNVGHRPRAFDDARAGGDDLVDQARDCEPVAAGDEHELVHARARLCERRTGGRRRWIDSEQQRKRREQCPLFAVHAARIERRGHVAVCGELPTITLSATNSRDVIWSGACSSGGNKTKTCTLTLNANAAVTANVQ